MAEFVASLQRDPDQTVEIRLSAKLATAIARGDARAGTSLDRPHPAQEAVMTSVTVERATAQRWSEQAWRAVGEGRIAPAEAQALSDQLAPRGAA